jgi:DNA-binding NarL/FixJ family response regulator
MIVDDHTLFRRGLREHLEASGLEVVGEADDADGAISLAHEQRPAVCLMDVAMPGASGIDAAVRMRAAAPQTRVVMLTVWPDEKLILAALDAGACGYLLKDSDGDRIVDAVRAAADGKSVLSPKAATVLIEHVRSVPASGAVPDRGEAPALTGRERDVLALIVKGLDNSGIASELVISPATVKSHVSRILEKLEVENRVQAAVAAVRLGLD